MIRADVVEHSTQCAFYGYYEIQNHRKRKGIIDFDQLMDLLALKTMMFKRYSGLLQGWMGFIH